MITKKAEAKVAALTKIRKTSPPYWKLKKIKLNDLQSFFDF
jgi:hypothetical protein